MKPLFIPYQTYQDFVFFQLKEHYSDGILCLVKNDWPTIKKLWLSDLSATTSWLDDTYSDSSKGTKPRDPASMLRSYLLSLLVQPTKSITHWVDQLRRVPLYAILSGYEPGDTPGVGTFHDFSDRIWASDEATSNDLSNPNARKRKNGRKKEKRKHPKNPGSLRNRSIVISHMGRNKPFYHRIDYSIFFNHNLLTFPLNTAYSETETHSV